MVEYYDPNIAGDDTPVSDEEGRYVKREDYERLDDCLQEIKQWCDAYPLAMFPEPDFAKAARVLKENGMTLDAISGSNMRHVLRGVAAIIDARLK